MFGYIAPAIQQLSEEEKARYRSCYCGLCRELHLASGNWGRLSLSNDMTFLSILLQSLYEPEEEHIMLSCPLHPIKKQERVLSETALYAAEMNLLLMYWKLNDNWQDDRKIASRCGMELMNGTMRRLENKYPLQCESVKGILEEMTKVEARASQEGETAEDLDLLCNLSGKMLGVTFVAKADDVWAETLFSIGEGLGRFVYLMDAYEDYDKDLRRKRFNPLCIFHARDDYEQFVKDSLEMLVAEATRAFEYLPLEKDLSLMRNVLYSGIWQRYAALQAKKEKEREKHNVK